MTVQSDEPRDKIKMSKTHLLLGVLGVVAVIAVVYTVVKSNNVKNK
jgi:hypothetical protein